MIKLDVPKLAVFGHPFHTGQPDCLGNLVLRNDGYEGLVQLFDRVSSSATSFSTSSYTSLKGTNTYQFLKIQVELILGPSGIWIQHHDLFVPAPCNV